MPQVDAEEFHAAVYDICRLIPRGRVTSYGHIAKLAGHPNHSRMVGTALALLGQEASLDALPGEGGGHNVPWQRVISSSGLISLRGPGDVGASRQAERLRAEGVEVTQAPGISQYRVSFSDSAGYAWFPASLAEARALATTT
ncbi:6-O-methylguanine-DNA methyltransferase MGMT/MGT1, involved in DNA repair [Ceraceosorus bombacis]|uniref:6-O-methylguanine-DNA methyltransferase MGMT/MGT1, involved in DNA repair n=2 Tax=Ceraceosorus TaxID=401624 RepID=A0A0N7L9A4_9BASI|nr:DNA binding methylated-DNA--cysteine S-methyltransferase [Ceraceosorus guamensis]PWN42602.1 DNA binding methylated-DNA--cysteine S-methyltransferase [Ceraceosorus guamensis]CEH13234.1 6-O-methylguanine-DNA methyltransferase MGMT/MGT1, involved in DNA repair [Ceraceosorus bombacis]